MVAKGPKLDDFASRKVLLNMHGALCFMFTEFGVYPRCIAFPAFMLYAYFSFNVTIVV